MKVCRKDPQPNALQVPLPTPHTLLPSNKISGRDRLRPPNHAPAGPHRGAYREAVSRHPGRRKDPEICPSSFRSRGFLVIFPSVSQPSTDFDLLFPAFRGVASEIREWLEADYHWTSPSVPQAEPP